MFHAFFEFSLIKTSVFPFIDTFAVCLAESVIAGVDIAVCKNIGSFAMLKAIDPASFVSVAILPLMDAVTVCFAVLPLSKV